MSWNKAIYFCLTLAVVTYGAALFSVWLFRDRPNKTIPASSADTIYIHTVDTVYIRTTDTVFIPVEVDPYDNPVMHEWHY